MAQRSPVPEIDDDGVPPVDWLTPEQARELFDADVRRLLGISTEEFLRRWDAGAYFDLDEYGVGRAVNELVMSMGVVRPDVHGKPRPRPGD